MRARSLAEIATDAGFPQDKLRRSMHLDDAKVRAVSDPAARVGHGMSLVAFHGAKPPPLQRLVEGLVARLGAALGDFPGLFRPYPLDQVHATLVGLEGSWEGDAIFNANARAREQSFGVPPAPLDLPGLVETLRRQAWPLPVRFGGQPPEARNPYDARPPWERAFDIREDGLAVLIGWPPGFAPWLLEMRKRVEQHGVVHKYHLDPAARDNDLFLVLGSVDAQALEALGDRREPAIGALARGREDVRRRLERAPVDVQLEPRQVSVVEYRSTTLEDVRGKWPLPAMDVVEVVGRYR
jgi:hypothetical protein